jgi:hypothetical protein
MTRKTLDKYGNSDGYGTGSDTRCCGMELNHLSNAESSSAARLGIRLTRLALMWFTLVVYCDATHISCPILGEEPAQIDPRECGADNANVVQAQQAVEK